MINGIVFLIEQVALGLYLVLGGLIVYTIWRWLRANREYRGTYFELERGIARDERGDAFTALVLLVEAVLLVVGMQRVVAPYLRSTQTTVAQQQQIALVSDGQFQPPVAPTFNPQVIDASGVQLGDANPADQIQPTPTLTPTPVGTIVSNATAADCTSPNVQLQVPANGMIVFEPITVIGIATTDNFAFYRFELKGASTSGNFATIGVDGTQPVTQLGELGQFVPSFYTPGEYRFRVSVFDTTNAVKASCSVTIYISAPIPSPTPLGTGTK